MRQLRAAGPLTNLPAQRSLLIGRDEDVVATRELLLHAVGRLVTLTGAGGCGKTSLALQIARDLLDEFPDGVWLVELASLADAALVPQALASALGVLEAPDRPLLDALMAYVRPRTLLLVLDNCEHLVDACAHLVETLLGACPELRILTTSREPLRIPHEVMWRVPSLGVPDLRAALSPDLLARSSAVRLFVERARVVRPSFVVSPDTAPAIAQICVQLDGIPLALELAAARVRVLAVEQIRARLDTSVHLLSGGSRTAVPRQRTLRATLDWSYDLLEEPEQALFRRLAVFVGGWSLEAVESVCAGDGIEHAYVLELLTRLVDKSLVLAEDRAGEARYRLLEPIRQYAQEHLRASGEAEANGRRHAQHFLTLVEQASPKLVGPEQVVWFARLEVEHDNLRATLAWAEEQGEAETLARLGAALGWFWTTHGHLAEGWRWLEAGLTHRGGVSLAVQARLTFAAGLVAMGRGEDARAIELLEEAADLAQQAGDTGLAAWALDNIGFSAGRRGDYAAGQRYHERSLALFRALGDAHGVATEIANLGLNARWRGDHAAARPLLAEGLALTRAVGNAWSEAVILAEQAALARDEGDLEQVAALASQSLRLIRAQQGQWYLPDCLELLAGVASARAQPGCAARLFGAADGVRTVAGLSAPPADRAVVADQVAAVRAALGEAAFAAAWFEGLKLPVEQAIEEALAPDEPVTLPTVPVRPAVGRRAGPLTPREEEIAALIAAGLTDRQIGERLVITGGTAGQHVAHILDKLGFRSRAQIAAWVAGRGPRTSPPD